MERSIVSTADAPQAIGPYSQAVIAAQTRQALTNLQALLAASGSSLAGVVKTTVFLADMNDFAAMNQVYAEFFTASPPARSTVQVARLPRDVRVEIEAVALRG